MKLPAVLLIGCIEESLFPGDEVGQRIWLTAATVEEALIVLQEQQNITLIVVDCCFDEGDKSILIARLLRQRGFSGWMIAMCVENDANADSVKREYDLWCSKNEIYNMIKSLI